jgi:hypothetical protein
VVAAGTFSSQTIDFNPQGGGDRRDGSRGTDFVIRLGSDRSYRGAFTLGRGPMGMGGPTANGVTSFSLVPQPGGFALAGEIAASTIDFDPRVPEKDERTVMFSGGFVSHYRLSP